MAFPKIDSQVFMKKQFKQVNIVESDIKVLEKVIVVGKMGNGNAIDK